MNGRQVEQWYDLLEVVQSGVGQTLALTVSRNGEQHEVQMRPYTDTLPDLEGKPKAIGRIGVAVRNDFISEKLDLPQAIGEGRRATAGASTQVVRTVRGLFSGRISGRNVGGPILIGQLAGESARMGLDTFLGFMALISINLAILNLLPVPVLDGGQFLFCWRKP